MKYTINFQVYYASYTNVDVTVDVNCENDIFQIVSPFNCKFANVDGTNIGQWDQSKLNSWIEQNEKVLQNRAFAHAKRRLLVDSIELAAAPILVWPFDVAPSELQLLSSNGGDEDWIAIMTCEYYEKYAWQIFRNHDDLTEQIPGIHNICIISSHA